jgi:hypothetical protein
LLHSFLARQLSADAGDTGAGVAVISVNVKGADDPPFKSDPEKVVSTQNFSARRRKYQKS